MKPTLQRICEKEVTRDFRIEKSYQIIFAKGQKMYLTRKLVSLLDSVAETTCMLERSSNYFLYGTCQKCICLDFFLHSGFPCKDIKINPKGVRLIARK